MSFSVGVDVGGTFTDLAAVGRDGRVVTHKVLSTPADQSDGVADAMARLVAEGDVVTRIAHGTTVVTNLLLERKGARVVLCATAGATDLLELRRQERAGLYDLSLHHPAPLVPADRIVTVAERVTVSGVRTRLTNAEATRVAAAVAALAPDIVVVALLHAYADDAHERRLAAAIAKRLPGVDVVTGAAVLPEIREYERTATAVAEGYARPRVRKYLERLGARLELQGLPTPNVMTSGGGMLPSGDAASRAASLALSGPAGGVVGAAAVLRAAGIRDALTIDIGGTSADAGLILNGEPLVEPGGSVAGVPIALPRVLVETVSAGGGSIAWVDSGGALRVGPQSAGAVPGPVAFGRGGVEPTVTDAHIALGRLDALELSGGVDIDASAARAAVAKLAKALGATPVRTAEAIIAIADASVARALRRVSVERGIDPRRCVLAAFGGGGPLHACALADTLGMRRIVVPPYAGVLSALGLAIAPERRDAATSIMLTADAMTRSQIADVHGALAVRARDGMTGSGSVAAHARVRYAGQGYELDVAFSARDAGAAIARRFEVLHRTRYGFVLDRPIEIVAARVTVSGKAIPLRLSPKSSGRTATKAKRADPEAARPVRGPAVVTLPDATMVVARGWTARPLAIGGWTVERR
ncbi:MAG: hydantoinase/oxoprolinase family protein [Gemmatimonadetes bacterium]|nr:hydantoinase/oxoprolinase family protein [Gemmatimonadota bacterium]